MLHKYLLIPALLAIGSLLMADSIQAAPRSSRGSGRATVSRSYSGARGGNYSRAGYGRGYYGGGNYGRGYYGGGFYGAGYYGWPGYGGYWPGYYSGYQPYWDNTYPYVNTYSDYVPAAAMSAPTYAAPVADGSARIEVIVPDPQARVLFDGAMTSQSGTDRMFTTPALSTNATYRIRATWTVAGRDVTQERVISVAPNQMTVVDFARPVGG